VTGQVAGKVAASWAISIATHRQHALEVLAENPGLKPRCDEAFAKALELDQGVEAHQPVVLAAAHALDLLGEVLAVEGREVAGMPPGRDTMTAVRRLA
jgi:hypothetical protein